MSQSEEDLETIYNHAISLIYHNQCIWDNIALGIKCGNSLSLARLIPEDNLHFKFDLNNGYVICNEHRLWMEENPEEANRLLFLNYTSLASFNVLNRGATFQEKADLEALGDVLRGNLNESVKKGVGPFSSFYGKFEV